MPASRVILTFTLLIVLLAAWPARRGQSSTLKPAISFAQETKPRQPSRKLVAPDALTQGLAVVDLTNRAPATLVNALLGTGVSVSNITFKGLPRSAGFFTGGLGTIGFEQGIVLSTGDVRNIIGPNQDDAIGEANGLPGDAQLESLIAGLNTRDATVLEFDFVPQGNVLSFQYVFASDEYNEFVGSNFNDVFGFFLNGQNVALLPGSSTTIAINNVNGGNPFGTNPSNSQFYINNDPDDGGTLNTEMDGLTVVLSVVAPVNAGQVNRIKLAIADASDSALDSNVLIKAASFTAQPPLTADLTMTQTATPNPVAVGEQLTYTINVTNNGPNAAEAFSVIDNLPAAVSFISCAAPGGSCGGTGNNRLITFPALAPGASVQVQLTTTAACQSGSSTISNLARVLSATFDPNQSNNAATTIVNLTAPPGQVTFDGPNTFDFGQVTAQREAIPNPPSTSFTIANGGCAPLPVSFAIKRTGNDVTSGRIANPDDSALFPLRLINADGSETAIGLNPGAAPITIPGGQTRRFRVQFNPLIPILAGQTTSLFANQVLPEVINSELQITAQGSTTQTINLTGRIATPVKLTHPADARLEPLVVFTLLGDEFTVECTTHDANLDLFYATYQFFDQNDRPVGSAARVELAQAIAARDLVRGQSFTIIQKFGGAARQPGIRKVQVTLFDREGSVTTAPALVNTNPPPLTTVSAASFAPAAVAGESIVAAFGQGLAAQSQAASATPLPTTLAGVTVRVRDGAGTERAAPLFFVAPGQINYQVPAGTMVGAATVTVLRQQQAVARSGVQVASAAPGLFTANATGQGAPAAVAVRLGRTGAPQYEAVAQFDAAQQRFVPRALDLGANGEQLYLALFGTGVRHRRVAATVHIGGIAVPALYAGAQGDFAGLDQINVLVPRQLAGRGEVEVTVTVDARTSNPVRVRFGGAAAATIQDFKTELPPAAAAYAARNTILLPPLTLAASTQNQPVRARRGADAIKE
jgi:uncharacterized protein (TIGR03437 family)